MNVVSKAQRDYAQIALRVVALMTVALVLLPFIYVTVRAFEAPLEQWLDVFSVSVLTAFVNTLTLSVSVTLASMALATPLAWLTARTNLPQRRFWSVVFALPLVIPSYVGAYLLLGTFGAGGLLAKWFPFTRIPAAGGFWGSLYLLTLLSYPYLFLSLRAALLSLDPNLDEAGRSLGQSAWQVWWKITLPQLKPAFASGGLLIALYVMRDFGAVAMLRYDTFTRLIYIQYQSLFDRTGAAILGFVLVLVTFIVVFLQARILNKQPYKSGKNTTSVKLVRLGYWMPIALLFCGIVSVATLGLPITVLIYWLIRSGEDLPAWQNNFMPLANSLLIAGVTSLLCVIAAYPLARWSVRYPSRLTRLFERLIYNSYALPGLVVGLALVFFGMRYFSGLYHSFVMLFVAYLILFLPDAVGTLRTALLQVSVTLEEAARSLGHTRMAVFSKITLPLIRPGLQAGIALVFLNTIKELPATLILSPFGFETLPMSIWMAVSEAYFAQAAIPALLLIIASGFPSAWLMINNTHSNEV